jgi:hypothetical protein
LPGRNKPSKKTLFSPSPGHRRSLEGSTNAALRVKWRTPSPYELLSAVRIPASAFQASEKPAGRKYAQTKRVQTTEFSQPGWLEDWILPSLALWAKQSADIQPAVLRDVSVRKQPLFFSSAGDAFFQSSTAGGLPRHCPSNSVFSRQ